MSSQPRVYQHFHEPSELFQLFFYEYTTKVELPESHQINLSRQW